MVRMAPSIAFMVTGQVKSMSSKSRWFPENPSFQPCLGEVRLSVYAVVPEGRPGRDTDVREVRVTGSLLCVTEQAAPVSSSGTVG